MTFGLEAQQRQALEDYNNDRLFSMKSCHPRHTFDLLECHDSIPVSPRGIRRRNG